MQIDDAARPKASSGLPALVPDGSTIPVVSVDQIKAETVRLSVALREYYSGEPYSYIWRHATIDREELPQFFFLYYTDPEKTLKVYFGWTGDAKPRAAPKPTAKAAPQPSPSLQAYIDLL